jgi:hypothetical protein
MIVLRHFHAKSLLLLPAPAASATVGQNAYSSRQRGEQGVSFYLFMIRAYHITRSFAWKYLKNPEKFSEVSSDEFADKFSVIFHMTYVAAIVIQ